MATTIARLSAVLSTDTDQFQGGFERAGVVVRRFQSRAEGSSGSLAQMAKELAHLQHGAERSSGSLLKMAAFGLGGGLVGLAALMVTLGHKAIEAADKFDEARRRIIEDINAMRAQANAGPANIPRELKQESAMEEIRREYRANIKEAKEFWGISSGSESKGALERLEEMKNKTKSWLEEQKKLRDEESKASAARERETNRLKESADSIAKSFRTPAEIWRDTITEITKLTRLGLLNLEQYSRATQKANEDLDNANKSARKIRDSTSSSAGTPAAQRFSQEAFSAIQTALREESKRAEIERQHLAVAREQEAELVRINQQLKDRPIVTIKTARLN